MTFKTPAPTESPNYVLARPAMYSLSQCFLALRYGKPVSCQNFLDRLAYCTERFELDSLTELLDTVIGANALPTIPPEV